MTIKINKRAENMGQYGKIYAEIIPRLALSLNISLSSFFQSKEIFHFQKLLKADIWGTKKKLKILLS